jgi:hypothetical protein
MKVFAIWMAAAVLSSGVVSVAVGQTAEAIVPTSCSTPAPAGPPAVTDAFKFGHPGENDPDRTRAGIRDLIVVKVKALCLLMDQAKCLGHYAAISCKSQDIALLLDGREIKGLAPESGAPRPDVETLQFRLDRSERSDAQWADLLGSPRIGERFFDREVAVSVGLQNEGPIPSAVQKFNLIRIHKWRFWICSAIMLLAIAGIVGLGRYTALLRYADKTSSYSLARCQMAFWFLLVIGAFSFIWLITGALDIVTNTALVLIGIGAGTALGGKVIDSSKEQGTKAELEGARIKRERLSNEVSNIEKQAAVRGTSEAEKLKLEREHGEKDILRKAAARKEAALTSKLTVAVSEGFWKDILSDGGNIRFDRFQIVVWTVILGVVFVNSVWFRLAMPEFDATLLTLMGISSGTYLGFKIPER